VLKSPGSYPIDLLHAFYNKYLWHSPITSLSKLTLLKNISFISPFIKTSNLTKSINRPNQEPDNTFFMAGCLCEKNLLLNGTEFFGYENYTALVNRVKQAHHLDGPFFKVLIFRIKQRRLF
jgi:hypothetical protein